MSEQAPDQTPPDTLHDDSAVWHAAYGAAWVMAFNLAHSDDQESALKMDHSTVARRLANEAVAQLRRR